MGVTHPSVPMFITRTFQRVLRIVALTLALRGLVLGHGLQSTKTKECLFAVLWRRVSLRHNAKQLALSAAVGLPFGQLYFLNVHIKIKSYLRGKFGFLRFSHMYGVAVARIVCALYGFTLTFSKFPKSSED